MDDFFTFLIAKKDLLEIILKILGLLIGSSSLLGLVGWVIQMAWIKNKRVEVQVLEIITDSKTLLEQVYGTEKNNSPLADHNIVYVSRDPDRDIQSEIRRELNKRHYLLIIGPTGYGKTREACMLAQNLIAEGYRVVRIKPGWLDEPKELPRDLGYQRDRVLIMLDDLNGLYRSGDYIQSPRIENTPLLMQSSYHQRLLKVIKSFEVLCGIENIRVIATARNEAEEWEILKYNINDDLWKRFGAPYELPHPKTVVLANFIELTASRCGLMTVSEDLDSIAGTNQGAYRNIVQNLRRLSDEYLIVSKDVCIPTLQGSWRENYEILIEKDPCIKFIYDAIDILLQAGIRLYVPIVLKLALWLWGGDRLQQIQKRRRLTAGFNFLVNERKILPYRDGEIIPYDGQIKDRGHVVMWEPFYQGITYLVLLFSDVYKNGLLDSLTSFYNLLINKGEFVHAEKIQKRILELQSAFRNNEFLPEYNL